MKYACPILLFLVLSAYTSKEQIPAQSFKKAFLDRINALRTSGCNCGNNYMPPVAPLTWNDQLATAARKHANDMAKNNYFSHISPNGKNLKDRVLSAGYTADGYRRFAIGENIALGQQTIDAVMNSWIKSEHHCQNLMNAAYHEVGIAERNTYWVQDFGGREK